MERKNPLRSPLILILLLAGIVITALSAYLFIRIDQVVHYDLYRYGLQFDYEWAIKYWTNARLILSFLAIAMMAAGIAVALVQFGAQTSKVEPTKLISCLLLVVGIVMTALSAFFLNELDQVIHNDLYRYGLQFSYEWAGQYWTYTRLMLSFLGLAMASNAFSMALIFTRARPRVPVQINSTQIISFLIFSSGTISIAFAINYSSSILAFIGLSLTFWGAILLYIRPEKYIKETLLDKTTLPILENLDQILRELGYKGKGIYLPPKYLEDFGSSKVYISAREDANLPSSEQMQIRENEILFRNPEGILITPPGAELARLFEKALGTSFTRVDLNYLQRNLPELLIEDLEIAKNLEIETRNSRVSFRIENSIYRSWCKEAGRSLVFSSVGCPLCSALACALAKATGSPIVVEKEQTSEDGKITNFECRLLGEPRE